MEQEGKDTNVKATIDAVTGLVKEIPVYQDTLQPAAKQIGKALETVAKTVNIALAPIKALVWGYDKIEAFITSRVSEKLKNVPEENIITPPPQVAGPAVEALRYAGHDENLRELYANLLANAMDKETVHKAHPGFVEILKNLSSDEAVLLQAFLFPTARFPLVDVHSVLKGQSEYTVVLKNHSHISKVIALSRPDLVPSYLDNLTRLGILAIPSDERLASDSVYEDLKNDDELIDYKDVIERIMMKEVKFDHKLVEATTFGKQFIQAVVTDKGASPSAEQKEEMAGQARHDGEA